MGLRDEPGSKAGDGMNARLNPLTYIAIAVALILFVILLLCAPSKAQPMTTTPTATIEPVIDPIWLYEAYLPIVIKGK